MGGYDVWGEEIIENCYNKLFYFLLFLCVCVGLVWVKWLGLVGRCGEGGGWEGENGKGWRRRVELFTF